MAPSSRLDERAPVFAISVAAELSGMHPQTLRQYDRLGLVVPQRTRGRGRRYSARDVMRLREIQALSQDQGVNLANYFVSYSFCCPSRTTILRGQYAHNHRIEGNDLPTGGFAKFKAMGHGRSTVATWLDAAGYHTGFFGKLMNGYEAEQDAPEDRRGGGCEHHAQVPGGAETDTVAE